MHWDALGAGMAQVTRDSARKQGNNLNHLDFIVLPKFATVRIAVLSLILLFFGFLSLTQLVYTRNWNQTIDVTIIPINADGHIVTADYINSLRTDNFTIIDKWAEREARRHNLDLETPFKVTLGKEITELPPAWPSNDNWMAVLAWGLRFRWWAYQQTKDTHKGLTTVRMFVMYHEGDSDEPLAHSLGMQKGLLGLVHAYALNEQTDQNNVVIAHELLHTVGATDKYSQYGSPKFPTGYADMYRDPLFPQRYAEIMAGRIPTSEVTSYMAESLRSAQINEFTALEINWIE